MIALEDVRILDLTWQGPGPYSTMILGDLGAEIIRIGAPPTAGARQIRREAGSGRAAYSSSNRNKKSILLNLKSDEGRKIFYRLAEDTDVIVEGFRPGVVERLGVDYPTMNKINPKIVYCSITGYGQSGPYRDLPGHDINYLAFSGVLDIIGESDRKPVIPINIIADYGAGAKDAAIGILSALIARGKTGKGQHVDISLTDSTIALLTQPVLDGYLMSGMAPRRGEHRLSGAYPDYTIYQTRDGKYLAIGCMEPWLWANLCRAIDKEELLSFSEYQGISGNPTEDKTLAEVYSSLQQVFLTRTRDEWFDLLSQKNVAVAKVYSQDEVFADPQVLHRQMVIDVEHPTDGKIKQVGIAIKLSDTPGKVRSLSPESGEHTEEILTGLGYSQQRISQLHQEEAIG